MSGRDVGREDVSGRDVRREDVCGRDVVICVGDWVCGCGDM